IYTVWSGARVFFFFFQAEDGIRDGHVTGVQTCALPIWRLGVVSRSARAHEARAAIARSPAELWTQSAETGDPAGQVLIAGLEERSEERRVGKECGCRWWRQQ